MRSGRSVLLIAVLLAAWANRATSEDGDWWTWWAIPLAIAGLLIAGCAPLIKPGPTASGWILWTAHFDGGNPWAEAQFETREQCAAEWTRRADAAARRGLRAYHETTSLVFTMRERPDTGFMFVFCMDARRDPTKR
jgi:hypothetical protein